MMQKDTPDEKRNDSWNKYMREFRRRMKSRGYRVITTVITEEQNKFIEDYAREMHLSSKKEAIMDILEKSRGEFDVSNEEK